MYEKLIRSFKGRQAQVLGHENVFKSAVLVPLLKEDEKYYVVFEKRALTLNRQPGEICFPGGEIEPSDGGAKRTAIRETSEELGLSENNIEVIAALDVMVSPFRSIVIPYLAFIKNRKEININREEVDSLLFVPLDFFLEYEPLICHIGLKPEFDEDYPFELIPGGRNYPFTTGKFPQVFYIWENEIIWGLTARIMYHLVELLKGKITGI